MAYVVDSRWRALIAAQEILEQVCSFGSSAADDNDDFRMFCDRSIALHDPVCEFADPVLTTEELRHNVSSSSAPWIAICRDLAIDAKRPRG